MRQAVRAVVAAACGALGVLLLPAAAGAQATATLQASCRADALAGVYHPWRLHVIESCMTVSGTVMRVRTEPDHDWHINLKLDPQFAQLVNAANLRYEHGDLVVEVIPMDRPSITRPRVGEHVTVTGAYVLDADHGWTEIHPAWLIDGNGRLSFTAAAASESVQTGIDGNRRHFGSGERD